MIKEFEFNRHKYWVLVEPAINAITHNVGYIAYVNDQKPSGLFYGEVVKNEKGQILICETELAALTNANAVKQSLIASRP